MVSCPVFLHHTISEHTHCQFVQQEHEDFSQRPRTVLVFLPTTVFAYRYDSVVYLFALKAFPLSCYAFE